MKITAYHLVGTNGAVVTFLLEYDFYEQFLLVKFMHTYLNTAIVFFWGDSSMAWELNLAHL